MIRGIVNLNNSNFVFLMEMTKDYLDGKIDSIEYWLDFPYELESRYNKLLREDRQLAELIYDCLIENGTNLYVSLTEAEFRERIIQEYDYISGIYQGG